MTRVITAVHRSGEPGIVPIGVASAGISSAGVKRGGVNATSSGAILPPDGREQ
jgi:hypothetical protein